MELNGIAAVRPCQRLKEQQEEPADQCIQRQQWKQLARQTKPNRVRRACRPSVGFASATRNRGSSCRTAL